jgi:hypothetical protein
MLGSCRVDWGSPRPLRDGGLLDRVAIGLGVVVDAKSGRRGSAGRRPSGRRTVPSHWRVDATRARHQRFVHDGRADPVTDQAGLSIEDQQALVAAGRVHRIHRGRFEQVDTQTSPGYRPPQMRPCSPAGETARRCRSETRATGWQPARRARGSTHWPRRRLSSIRGRLTLGSSGYTGDSVLLRLGWPGFTMAPEAREAVMRVDAAWQDVAPAVHAFCQRDVTMFRGHAWAALTCRAARPSTVARRCPGDGGMGR